jgi:hypothetical protein
LWKHTGLATVQTTPTLETAVFRQASLVKIIQGVVLLAACIAAFIANEAAAQSGDTIKEDGWLVVFPERIVKFSGNQRSAITPWIVDRWDPPSFETATTTTTTILVLHIDRLRLLLRVLHLGG